jgi:hypothetical protein
LHQELHQFTGKDGNHRGFGGLITALAMVAALEQAGNSIQLGTYDKLSRAGGSRYVLQTDPAMSWTSPITFSGATPSRRGGYCPPEGTTTKRS